MRELLNCKVEIARTTLRLSQSGVERESGYDQARISLLESGKTQNIPTIYLSFLAKNKINLTAMFDNNVSLEDFEVLCKQVWEGEPAGAVLSTAQPCSQCKLKDDIITVLQDGIKDMRHFMYAAGK